MSNNGPNGAYVACTLFRFCIIDSGFRCWLMIKVSYIYTILEKKKFVEENIVCVGIPLICMSDLMVVFLCVLPARDMQLI